MVLQLDLSRRLEEQGPLDAIIHKLTDHIVEADQNVIEAQRVVQSLQVELQLHHTAGLRDFYTSSKTTGFRSFCLQFRHHVGLVINRPVYYTRILFRSTSTPIRRL